MAWGRKKKEEDAAPRSPSPSEQFAAELKESSEPGATVIDTVQPAQTGLLQTHPMPAPPAGPVDQPAQPMPRPEPAQPAVLQAPPPSPPQPAPAPAPVKPAAPEPKTHTVQVKPAKPQKVPHRVVKKEARKSLLFPKNRARTILIGVCLATMLFSLVMVLVIRPAPYKLLYHKNLLYLPYLVIVALAGVFIGYLLLQHRKDR